MVIGFYFYLNVRNKRYLFLFKRTKQTTFTNSITNLQEIEFNCIRSKLQENVVKFNQRECHIKYQLKHLQLRIITRNIVTCNNFHHNFIGGGRKN